ncbi:uncharacterized protein N7482_003185 [Penicillium canariense]|uniref:PBP domain-containing protein n=1 Tax=Penicillium canariense TaxID=189055 RepID=A0A9W9LNW9_9EURO|nr:uncharacterized protein N7482_003185 [Penicillium canariense]KAJ5167591.1 hypothetical protein N7482_003185 [Penicillium canariense]
MKHSSSMILGFSLGFAGLSLGKTSNQAPFVNLMTPTLPTYASQTEEQAARGSLVGRFPGFKELLQPSIDPGLASYQPVTQPLQGNYTLASSDVLAVLSQQWIDAFMLMYPNVTMQIPAPHAGSLGALELTKGTLDGVFVSRELKPSDIDGFSAKFGYPPTSIPICGGSYRQFGFLDAMAFVVNKENPVEHLTFDQLDSIFSTTRARGGPSITTWGQLGVGGELGKSPINIYGIKPWNGFEEFIRQRVLSYNGRSGIAVNNTAKDPHVTWDATVFNMSRYVANDPAGIAYTGLAYIDRPVKVLGTTNPTTGNLVTPTYENIAMASWPLARIIYFNLNSPPHKGMDPVLRELVKFVLSKEGQQILLDQGVFLPFREFQQKSSLNLL